MYGHDVMPRGMCIHMHVVYTKVYVCIAHMCIEVWGL